MSIVGLGISQLVMLLFVGGGVGLPLGVPPGPEDEVLARLVPEKCLFCLAWNGMAQPDPKSSNHTERLLAEPEVQKFLAGVERAIVGRLRPPPEVVLWIKTLLTRPGIFYVGKIDLRLAKTADGPPRDVQAGLIVNTGELTGQIRASLEKYQARLPKETVKTIEAGGESGYRIDDGRNPVVTWGTKDSYTGFAVGQGEAEAILRRAEGEPPRWLTAALERLAVPRRGSLVYADIRYWVETLAPTAPPDYRKVLQATGVDGLTSVSLVSGLDDEGFASRMLVGLDGPPRGFLKALIGKPLAAKDLAPLPADSQIALINRLDVARLYDAIVALIDQIVPAQAKQSAAARAAIDSQLGLSVRQDVLGALGDVWAVYSSPGDAMFPFGLTGVVAVRDAVKLRHVQERLLAAAAKTVSGNGREPGKLERTQLDGREVIRYELPAKIPMFISPAWTIDEHYLVGSLAVQSVKAFLTRKPDAKSLADVPEVARWFSAGQGPLAVSYQDTAGLFRAFYSTLQLFSTGFSQKLREAGIDFDVALLPTTNAIAQHLRPAVCVTRQVADGFEIDTRATVPGGNQATLAPFVLGLTLPAVQAVRTTARRAASTNNIKQLLLAILNYESSHGSFPPAYTVDKQGQPLLSWRVAILPHIEQESLYRQFHLDEPWDSPHNKQLIAKMPPLFRSPRSAAGPGRTCYLTVRGKDTVFCGAEKVKLADIANGTSHTIVLVEANDQAAVIWTRPDDFRPDPKQPTKGLDHTWPGGFLAGFADGHAQQLPLSIKPEDLRSKFSKAQSARP